MLAKSEGIENLRAFSWLDRGGEVRETNPAVFGDASDPDLLRFKNDAFCSSNAEAREEAEFEKGGGMGEAACDGLLDGVCTLPGDCSLSGVIPCISSPVEFRGCT